MGFNWIGLIVGAVIGGLVSYFIQCNGNTCPLTGNWMIASLIGAAIGASWPTRKTDAGSPPDEASTLSDASADEQDLQDSD